MEYRLFAAVDIPEEVRTDLSRLCGNLEKVRWTDRNQFHLTLRFIGEGDGALVRDICEQFDLIDLKPFDIFLNGTGHFPLRGEPKILTALIAPSTGLKRLYCDIEKALVQCGFEREGRRFIPHITIGRLKGESHNNVGKWLSGTSTFRSVPFTVNSFHLYTSHLTPDGAQHRKLESF